MLTSDLCYLYPSSMNIYSVAIKYNPRNYEIKWKNKQNITVGKNLRNRSKFDTNNKHTYDCLQKLRSSNMNSIKKMGLT